MTPTSNAQATPNETNTRQMGDSHEKSIASRACSGVLMPDQTPEGENRGGHTIITRDGQAATAQNTESPDSMFAGKISHITIKIRDGDTIRKAEKTFPIRIRAVIESIHFIDVDLEDHRQMPRDETLLLAQMDTMNNCKLSVGNGVERKVAGCS
jgi:hypothetical protein